MRQPSWLSQLDAPRTVAQIEAAEPAAPKVIIDPKAQAEAENAKWALEDVVKREPERVAAQLKTWLAEDA